MRRLFCAVAVQRNTICQQPIANSQQPYACDVRFVRPNRVLYAVPSHFGEVIPANHKSTPLITCNESPPFFRCLVVRYPAAIRYHAAMLLLFDVDGTLLDTHHAGRDAMADAGRELFGDAFSLSEVEIAGRLDWLIYRDAAAANEIEDPTPYQDEFRRLYGENLKRRFENGQPAELLPGVGDLIEKLTETGRHTLGVLTGNFPETGRLKIASAGLDPDIFTITAWGSDGNERRELPAVAMRRYHEKHDRAINPLEVVIFGDTPHDVDCARANGCRSLAVGTGQYSVEILRACRPHHVVENLADFRAILTWMDTLS